MANFISLTGFVSSDIQISSNGKNCSFSINFYDTRRNNESVYSFMTVKIFDFSATPKKKDLVNVNGSIHKHTWNGKEYTEIWCSYDGWSKVERRNKENNNSDGSNNAPQAKAASSGYNNGSNSNTNTNVNTNANNNYSNAPEPVQEEFQMEDVPF